MATGLPLQPDRRQPSFGSRLSVALIAGALGGAVLAALVASQTPSRYVSSAMVRIPASHSMRDIQVMSLSRASLHDVIEKERIYQHLTARLPMEDVIDRMRRDVEFQCLNDADLCGIRFAYENAIQAQRVTRDLLDKMSVPGLTVINPPLLPQKPEHPTRLELTGIGLAGGFVLTMLAAGLRRSFRIRFTAAAALIGGVLAAAISFALPRTYISISQIAVARVPRLDRAAAWRYWTSVSRRALGDDVLVRLINSARYSIGAETKKELPELIQELRKRIDIKPVCSDEFSIAVSYSDPAKAQLLNAQLVTNLIEEAVRLQREPAAIASQPSAGLLANVDSSATVREGQGQLRKGIEGIDVGNMPGRTNPQDSLAELLPRGLPPGTPEWQPRTLGRQTTAGFPVTPAFRPQKETALPPDLPRLLVVDSASLPDAPARPNRFLLTLAGIVGGLVFGVVASMRLRPRADTLSNA